jgi:hypothetical protein
VPIYEEEEEEEEDHLSAGLVKVEPFNVACCLAGREEEDLNRCARAFDLKTRIRRRCSEDELNRRQLLKVQAGRDDAAEVCRALNVAAGASGPQRLSAPADAARKAKALVLLALWHTQIAHLHTPRMCGCLRSIRCSSRNFGPWFRASNGSQSEWSLWNQRWDVIQ